LVTLAFTCLSFGGFTVADAQLEKQVIFLLDGSGSISAADFALEKTGLALAVQNSNLVPTDGTLAIGLVQFADTTTSTHIPLTLIDDPGDIATIVGQINAITQIGGLTNPGDGVNTANGLFAAGADPMAEQGICLITDGTPNSGANLPTALTNAQAAPYGLDSFGVMAIEDPGNFSEADAIATYGPLIFGGGGLTVVASAVEFANTVGPTCFGAALKLVGIEVNQAIQDWTNSVQLIQGKRTYVRAHIEPLDPMEPMVVAQARLRGFSGGVELAGSPLTALNPGGQIIAMQNATMRRGVWNDSLNFRLPNAWATGTLTLRLEALGAGIDCTMAAGADNDCNIVNPMGMAVSFTPTDQPTFDLVRVSWTNGAGTTFTPTLAQITELQQRLLAIYPVSSYLTNTRSHTYGGALSGGNPSLGTLNGELATKRFYDGCFTFFGCQRIYNGVLRNAALGGLANGIPSKTCSGNMPAGANAYGRNRHAHEIAHCLGIRHAPLCGAIDPAAPMFPFVTGGNATLGPMGMGDNLQVWGMDTHRIQVVNPNNTFEMMSYCGPNFRWVSSFTYNNIKSAIDTIFAVAPPAMGPPTAYLIVRGNIDLSGSANPVEFHPFGVYMSSTTIPAPDPGNYTLELLDDMNTVIDSISFQPEEFHADTEIPGTGSSDPEIAHFLIPVEFNPAIVQARITQGSMILGDLTASMNPPTISIDSPAGGETFNTEFATFEWTGGDLDGDALRYLVQYSADAGITWETLSTDLVTDSLTVERANLSGSSDARLKVQVSDGFNVREEISNAFSVGNNAPVVTILSPQTGELYSGVQTLTLEAVGLDPEDGNLTGANIQWSSDLDGNIATGANAQLTATSLTEGVHTISCLAIDSVGLTATESVVIAIQVIFDSEDCNNNGLADLIDIALGTSLDCNSNAVPDECDLTSGQSSDCNNNSIPDECDIQSGLANDCNNNSVPDNCDIATGTSLDCNGNNIPDSCDIASGTSNDLNGDGVPDECAQFQRGDASADGNLGIEDAIQILGYLVGGSAICLDANDYNDDGSVNIVDPIALLSFLFQGGMAPPAPTGSCGEDPTLDSLDCFGPVPTCP